MEERIKSLKEVSEHIGEKIGEIKQFDPEHGYFTASFREGKGIERSDTKIRQKLSFTGTKHPISFGFFKSKKGYTSRYKNNKNYANHYGEYIAYIALKQLGKKACKVDLGEITIIHPYSHEKMKVPGILSHFHLSQEDSFLPISFIINGNKNILKSIDKRNGSNANYEPFFEKGKTNSDHNYTNIEVILKSLELYFTENNQAYKIPEVRKKFFDMCIFDLKFANRDRHDENFGVKVNQRTGEIDFYHLFDNEQILGMQEEQKDVALLLKNESEYQKFKRNYLTSCIGVPRQTQKIDPTSLLKYMLEHYYEETMDSIRDIGRYQLSDLEKVMELCPGLSTEHKSFARKIFIERDREMKETVATYEKNEKDVKSL